MTDAAPEAHRSTTHPAAIGGVVVGGGASAAFHSQPGAVDVRRWA
jgi:hypothetical protein